MDLFGIGLFRGDILQPFAKCQHRAGLGFVVRLVALDDLRPKVEGPGILFGAVEFAGFGERFAAEVVGFLEFFRPRVLLGEFRKLFLRFLFAASLEVDQAESENRGGLRSELWILRTAGRKLLLDTLEDGAGLLVLVRVQQGPGETLQIPPVESDLGFEGFLVSVLVKAEGESDLVGLKRYAGLGEEDLGHQSGVGTGFCGQVPERFEAVLDRGLSRLEAKEGQGD